VNGESEASHSVTVTETRDQRELALLSFKNTSSVSCLPLPTQRHTYFLSDREVAAAPAVWPAGSISKGNPPIASSPFGQWAEATLPNHSNCARLGDSLSVIE